MLSSTLLFLSAPDITVILLVALVFFGGKKLPELARGLGQGIKEFKDATDGSTAKNDPPVTPPAPPVTPPAAEHKPTLDLSKPGDTQPPVQQ